MASKSNIISWLFEFLFSICQQLYTFIYTSYNACYTSNMNYMMCKWMCIVVGNQRKEIQRVKKWCWILKPLHNGNKKKYFSPIYVGQVSLRGGRPARHTGPWLWLLELHAYYSPFLCSYSYNLMFISCWADVDFLQIWCLFFSTLMTTLSKLIH